MQKLYKRLGDRLHYHEAWKDGGNVVEHWGTVGERGNTREHSVADSVDEDRPVRNVLQSAFDDGFRPVAIDDHAILMVEYTVDGFGTADDLTKRHSLEDLMNETLGWTGLGFCDGGSIGSGTMEVCCFVVDYDVAKQVVEAHLDGTAFADYVRIYREDVAD